MGGASGISARPGRGKVTDEIIGALQADIAGGALERGARLPNERDLAQHFGVSQPTVREAIRALDAMGLVDVRHGSGAYVTADSQRFLATSLQMLLQIERVGILDALELRGVLGRWSARRAAENATPEDVEAIRSLLQQLEEIKQERDLQRIAQIAVSFQVAVSAATHNPLLFAIESFLARMLVQFQLTAKARRGVRFWHNWTLQFADDRRRLFDAIEAGDPKAAEAAMSTYLADQHERFASDRQLAGIRLSDPQHVRTLAEGGLDIPEMRPDKS
jgi:GntR family transcriptional repressor for pyruvate dehydrogenase complex